MKLLLDTCVWGKARVLTLRLLVMTSFGLETGLRIRVMRRS